MAEEFIQGKQFTVDGYVKPDNLPKSLAIGEKFMYSEKVQVAMGISYPASLDDKDYNRLLLLNEDVNFKLGYSFGMIHSEYMLRDGEFFLIESSNRGGGCLTSELIVPYASQIDLVGQYISDCIDSKSDGIHFPEVIPKTAVTLCFFSLPNGVFKGIMNWNEITSRPECIFARLNVSIGDYISDVTSDANRHGFFKW